MIYNPNEQYRCTIIRGKAKTAVDNLLPAYATIVEEICPCDKEAFAKKFDARLSEILRTSSKKTLDNHRTEIAGMSKTDLFTPIPTNYRVDFDKRAIDYTIEKEYKGSKNTA